MNKIEEIKKLKSLFDQGAITQDEFNILKQNVLVDGNSVVNQSTEIKTHKKKNTQQAIKSDIYEIQPKKKSKAFIWLVLIGSILVFIFTMNYDSPSSTSDDRAVLTCIFCKKIVVEENGKDLIYYTNEVDGCAVHAVNSGSYNAFCSPQCCKAYRIAWGQ